METCIETMYMLLHLLLLQSLVFIVQGKENTHPK